MTQQLTTYDIHTFIGHNGATVYSLWAHFSNDTVVQCGYYGARMMAEKKREELEEFAAKLLQAAKDSF